MTAVLPMFPLGTVLFPSGVLPLHVFEPRYRALVRDCLDADREFGTVLIERGSEVGGGDTRFDVGTRARIVEAQRQDDGRWLLVAVGTRRLRVARWLPDDPYPRAEVADLPEVRAAADTGELAARVVSRLRRALALKAELGEPAAPVTTELDDDPVVASYQAAVLSPIGPLDAQRVLEADEVGRRWQLLANLLEDEVEVLARRMAGR